MNEILTITKKEFARFFSNKFTAFAALFLPGLLMAGIYSAMGNMEGMGAHDDNETFTVAVSHLPASIETIAKDSPITFVKIEGEVPDKESMRQAIDEEKYDAYAVFPEDFDAAISSFSKEESRDDILPAASPIVSIYYDDSSEKSHYAYEGLSALLDSYETSLANVFDINTGDDQYDLAEDNDVLLKIFGTVLPMLILIMLISSIIAISAESIAGEKERGTIATLLTTPINRSSIVWGKLITVASVGVVSTIFSLAGIVVGFANMSNENVSFSLYSVRDYALLAGVLIPFALMISVLMIILSALAPNIRSAQVYFTAVQLSIMALAILVSVNASGKAPLPYFLIPFYDTARALVDIFAFNVSGMAVLLTALVNIALSVLGVFVAQKILNSERFMFQK